jgi:hypothetical protein
MIWKLYFKLYILVYNFFATIEAFHIHVQFHYDEIDNEWNKRCMLAHHSCKFKKLPLCSCRHKRRLGLSRGVSTLHGTRRCSCHFPSLFSLPPPHEHAWMLHYMYMSKLMATLQMFTPWNFTKCMVGLTCGFSICFVAISEPCGFVSTLGKIGELLYFPWEHLVKLVNGQT